MTKTIPSRRINRPKAAAPAKPKPGPVPDPELEKCDCNLTFLLTQSEWQKFEKLRASMPIPPTRSQLARFLVNDALSRRFRRDLPGNARDFSRV
jgi:hypothetical protein